MVITQITYQKKDPSRVNIFVDGEFALGVSVNTLAKENLYESKEIEASVLEKIVQDDLYERFLNRVVEYLGRAPKSEFQIRKYLKELQYKKRDKWFDKEILLDWEKLYEKIITKLKDFNYLNDESFARAFVNSRLSNKPRGKTILIGELISKGVDKELAANICNELIEDEYMLLDQTFKKKYKEQPLDLSNTKMVNFLQRKGFSWDLIEQYARDESTK